MIPSVTAALSIVAAGVAVAAGVLSLPTPPALSGERWFKVVLITLLRGRTEAAEGDAAAWEAAVKRFVPYHPAARLPERKLLAPGEVILGEDVLLGEPNLVARLASLPTPRARYVAMYEEDEVGLAARLSDPVELGPEHDLAARLGAGASWDTLADWGADDGDAFVATLTRISVARWVMVGTEDPSGVLAALAALVPGATSLSATDVDSTVSAPSDRLVVVVSGDAAQDVLRILSAQDGLRDHVAAVVSVGGNLRGRANAAAPYDLETAQGWIRDHFSDRGFDLEVHRRLPLFCLQWLDPACDIDGDSVLGAHGLPVEASRFPSPLRDGDAGPCLEVVDLGVLPADADLPADLVARALWTVVTAWTRARR